jgi:hypothetical protein
MVLVAPQAYGFIRDDEESMGWMNLVHLAASLSAMALRGGKSSYVLVTRSAQIEFLTRCTLVALVGDYSIARGALAHLHLILL